MPPTPKQQAREKIDALLVAAGLAVQDYRAFNPSAARGIALREGPLTARPSKQTNGFFAQNLVMEYAHERAVADANSHCAN